MDVTRIGLDIAKNVFQVHGVDAHGKVGVRKQLSRSKVLSYFAQLAACRMGIEAWGSAHYWGREWQKLGHDVRLMAVQLLKPSRTKQQNDRHEAEARCEAVARPQMRFVPSKTVEHQSVLTVHRARELLGSERTAVAHQMRGLLMEYGVVIAPGIQRLRRELPTVLTAEALPTLARHVVTELQARLQELDERITGHDRQSAQLARQREAAKRVRPVEGVGPITATAVVATVGDAKGFHHGRQFAAWLGLVPRQFSTGGKPVLGRITKRASLLADAPYSWRSRGLTVHGQADGRQEYMGRRGSPPPRGHHRRRGFSRQACADSVGVVGRGTRVSEGCLSTRHSSRESSYPKAVARLTTGCKEERRDGTRDRPTLGEPDNTPGPTRDR